MNLIELLKAAKYDTTRPRTDAQGRVWEFNQETRRWRLKDGRSKKKSSTKAPTELKPKAKKKEPPKSEIDVDAHWWKTKAKKKAVVDKPSAELKPKAKKKAVVDKPSAELKPKTKEDSSLNTKKVEADVQTQVGSADKANLNKLVSINKISSSQENIFPKKDVDEAANAILETGGLVRPLIVERDPANPTSKYKLIGNNDFAYKAAMKAYEIDPRSAEVVTAVVLDNPDQADAIRRQVDLFDKHRSNNPGLHLKASPTEVTQYGLISQTGIQKNKKNVPSQVTVSKISAAQTNKYPQEDIDAAAQAILRAGGLIEPLMVVRDPKSPMNSYQLVGNDDFAYQAAKRAREIDPISAGNTKALIIENADQAKSVDRQMRILHQFNQGGQNLSKSASFEIDGYLYGAVADENGISFIRL